MSSSEPRSDRSQRDEWLAIVRDISDPVRVEDEPHLIAGLVLTTHDARGPFAAGPRKASSGSVVLADGRRARFSLHQRPTASASDEPRLRFHEAGFDLVPEGTPVVVGHLPWNSLISLRKEAQIHRPLPPGAPQPSGR